MKKMVAAFVLLLTLGSVVMAAAAHKHSAQLYTLDDENVVPAPKGVSIAFSPKAPVRFKRLVVDERIFPNGRKPKVIIDPGHKGFGIIGAPAGDHGFALYRTPGSRPTIVSSFHGGEDAQAVDITGNGMPDIIIGGLSGETVYLRNPGRDPGCSDPLHCAWKVQVIDRTHSSHDVVVGDINHDGRIDVATESGVYFPSPHRNNWTFVGRDLIGRDGEGTSLGDFAGDGILDIVAPRNGGTQLARFINPLHHGGDPTKDTWKPEVIDAHPLFTGNMTTAVADFTGDGKKDVLLAPMYGGGGLAWYHPPSSPGGAWKRRIIDRSVNFVHQGSLQPADFDGDGKPDVAFAEQDQSPTRRVAIFYHPTDASRRRLQVLSNEGGHNIKVGDLEGDRRPSILVAPHGAFGLPNPLVAWRNLGPARCPTLSQRGYKKLEHYGRRLFRSSPGEPGAVGTIIRRSPSALLSQTDDQHVLRSRARYDRRGV